MLCWFKIHAFSLYSYPRLEIYHILFFRTCVWHLICDIRRICIGKVEETWSSESTLLAIFCTLQFWSQLSSFTPRKIFARNQTFLWFYNKCVEINFKIWKIVYLTKKKKIPCRIKLLCLLMAVPKNKFSLCLIQPILAIFARISQ